MQAAANGRDSHSFKAVNLPTTETEELNNTYFYHYTYEYSRSAVCTLFDRRTSAGGNINRKNVYELRRSAVRTLIAERTSTGVVLGTYRLFRLLLLLRPYSSRRR